VNISVNTSVHIGVNISKVKRLWHNDYGQWLNKPAQEKMGNDEVFEVLKNGSS
jgi:hypothetical protein